MVVSHLFCQGVELLFKAILLLIDYDKYYPKLRKIGHNLLRGAEEVHDAVGLNFCDGPVGAELGKLNSFYMQHMLRYATLLGLLHGAASIQFDHVFRRTAAVVRLTSRKIRELPAP